MVRQPPRPTTAVATALLLVRRAMVAGRVRAGAIALLNIFGFIVPVTAVGVVAVPVPAHPGKRRDKCGYRQWPDSVRNRPRRRRSAGAEIVNRSSSAPAAATAGAQYHDRGWQPRGRPGERGPQLNVGGDKHTGVLCQATPPPCGRATSEPRAVPTDDRTAVTTRQTADLP